MKKSRSILDLFDRQDASRIVMIPSSKIRPSRYQPRLRFDEEALEELAESIRENGLIQPITVRKMDDGYEIIAGERRYRACLKADYSEIPCYIMSPTEEQAAQMALVENVQRENLSAIEEAKSYVQIMRQAGLTQEQVAKKIGKSQSAVANKIRLLNLPDEIQQAVIDGQITERHGRALLSAPEKKQKEIYRTIVKKNLNVRQSEEYIEKMNKPEKVHKRQKTKGFTRNVQIAINSVNQCAKMIEKMGIHTTVDMDDRDDEVRMIIRIPK
ncbi:MAG: nucleoid occlusion protein [Erysipelotrichaceae bacterium]|nr:nucleoid occlusion protein [Erysipelotrichaceae bacterium]